MKYIIDIDCLKDCLELLEQPVVNRDYVSLSRVKALIDSFPKEEPNVCNIPIVTPNDSGVMPLHNPLNPTNPYEPFVYCGTTSNNK